MPHKPLKPRHKTPKGWIALPRAPEIAYVEQHPEIYQMYRGEIIVVHGDAVVAHAKTGEELHRQTRELGLECPRLFLIPDEPGPYI